MIWQPGETCQTEMFPTGNPILDPGNLGFIRGSLVHQHSCDEDRMTFARLFLCFYCEVEKDCLLIFQRRASASGSLRPWRGNKSLQASLCAPPDPHHRIRTTGSAPPLCTSSAFSGHHLRFSLRLVIREAEPPKALILACLCLASRVGLTINSRDADLGLYGRH